MDLTVIQRSLKDVSCPSCKKSSMNAVLRCDLGQDQCVVTIECQGCREVYEALNPDQHSGNSSNVTHICPECRSKPTSNMKMHLDLSAKKAHYTPIACDGCLRPSKAAPKAA